jgi:3-hydroxyisobutyrate dehydrogenase
MAANLARAGFAVRSFDRNGKGSCASAREAAQSADALITMLPDGDAVREALLEALPALAEGTVVIDMSSSDPAATRALAPALQARKIGLLDAPVSGAVAKARDGTLAIMVGGEIEAMEKVRPVLAAMGSDLFHVGPLGAGHAVKALNNYLGAAGTLAGFEALRIAQAFGLDPKPMLAAINASTGRNSTTERKIPQQVLTGAFASGFKLALMAKDVGIAARLARDLGIAAPYLEKTLHLWRAAQRALPADADHTEIYRFLERIRPAASARPPRARKTPAPPRRGAAPRPGRSRRSAAPARRGAARRT